MARTKQTARKHTGCKDPRKQRPNSAPSQETNQERRSLEFKQFKAWIRVDGQPAQCYAIDVDKKQKVVSCWIASERGKEFALFVEKTHETRCSIRTALHIDTRRAGHSFWKRNDLHRQRWQAFHASKTIERPYVFSDLNTTDDDSYLEPDLRDTRKKHGALGDLTFKVHRVTRLVKMKTKKHKDDTSDEEEEKETEIELEKVHERSKAGISMKHQAGLGERRRRAIKTASKYDTSKTRSLCSEVKELLVTFIFRYRTLEVLQNAGIAPNPDKEDDSKSPEVVIINPDGSLKDLDSDEEDAKTSDSEEDTDEEEDWDIYGDDDDDNDDDDSELTEEDELIHEMEEQTEDTRTALARREDTPNILPAPSPPRAPTPYATTMSQDVTPFQSAPSNSATTANSERASQTSPDSTLPMTFPGRDLTVPTTDQTIPENSLKRAAPEIVIKEEDIKPDPDVDGVEERRKALLAELAQLDRMEERLKREGLSPQKKIKREEPVAPVGFFKPGETIDLTL